MNRSFCDMGVDLGCLQVGMTQKFLNETDVCALFQEVSCESMSQAVDGE